MTMFTPQDEATIREMFTTTPDLYRAGDWRTWTSYWAEDGFFQVPNGTTARGRAALQAWAESLGSIEDISFGDIQVQGEGNLAFGTSSYVLKLRNQPAADSGKQLVVFRREPASGKWEVVAASFNSSLPLPTATPDAVLARE